MDGVGYPRRCVMKRDGKIVAMGLTFFVVGLVGCQDSPTEPRPFGLAERHSLIGVQVQNQTAVGISLAVELGASPDEIGTEGTGEEIILGTVAAGEDEVFFLEPLAAASGPVRFIAESDAGEEPVVSEWMWLEQGVTVSLLVTSLEVVRTDGPNEDFPKPCPAHELEPCM